MAAYPPAMDESVVIWAPGRSVPMRTIGAGPAVLLAHGAGAGPEHPFITGLAGRIAARGFAVTTFSYPYVAEGRRAPDRLDRLLAAHAAVATAVHEASGHPPFLAGKSMGGRVGSHLDLPTPGRIFFGYPLVAMGSSRPRDTTHLGGPMLFVQGARDRLAPLDLIERVVATVPGAELVVIPDADHGFAVPKRTGIEPEEMLDRLAAHACVWMLRHTGGGA